MASLAALTGQTDDRTVRTFRLINLAHVHHADLRLKYAPPNGQPTTPPTPPKIQGADLTIYPTPSPDDKAPLLKLSGRTALAAAKLLGMDHEELLQHGATRIDEAHR